MSGELRRGLEHLEAGRLDEALAELEVAHRAQPNDPAVLHALGRAVDLAGDRERAIGLLARAHHEARTEPGPACDLALLLLEDGEDERAQKVLEPTLAAHPEDPRLNLTMAMALTKTSTERARTLAAKALEAKDAELRAQAQALYATLSQHF